MLGGILAFGMIVYGAVKYTMSGGNPSGQSEAKDAITQALLGLLLLMGAFIVLNLINPELTRLNLPELGKIEAVREGPLPAAAALPPPGMCGSPPDYVGCESLSATVGCKTQESCSAHPDVAAALTSVEAESGADITVTESMPPTSQHVSGGHLDGCSVDVRVEGDSCENVAKVIQTAQKQGFSVNNEYPACGGGRSQYWTAPHLHLTKSNCPSR
jgi:hypothetical protein